MKKQYKLFFIAAAALFTACQDHDIPLSEVSIKEQVEVSITHASLSCDIVSNADVSSVTLVYSTPQGEQRLPMNGQKGHYTALLENLEGGTTYRYVYELTNELSAYTVDNDYSFTTRANGVPVVELNQLQCVNPITLSAEYRITDIGGHNEQITEQGVCYSTINDNGFNITYDNSMHQQGQESMQVKELMPNTTYFVRAYARNSHGIGYSARREVTTTATATITTLAPTDVTATSAVFNCTRPSGVSNVRFLYGTTPEAQLSIVTTTTSAEVDGLQPNTTYYVRVVADTQYGEIYGSQLQFTTLTGLPTVQTNGYSWAKDATTAQCSLKVISDGGFPLIEKGICYSTAGIPTVHDNFVVSDTEAANATVTIEELNPAQTYYIRAFARNAQGIAYGDTQEMKNE